ncbi:MAG: FAD-dependent oxidoreductase [Gammaproteobacteria bacterium]|nr:FAD-dependent oxidoreductase [Gammaproteobacteria bacterium]
MSLEATGTDREGSRARRRRASARHRASHARYESDPGLQVTLISPDPRTAYSGMLPGVVAGHYDVDDIHIELGPLCRFAGARFIRTAAEGIDPVARRVHCAGRPDIAYDVLSVDVGITPALDAVPGAREHAIAVKPINHFLEKFDAFLERARGGQVRHIGFVGAGAGGIELCLAVDYRLRQEGVSVQSHIFTDAGGVLPGYPTAVREPFEATLRERGIKVHREFRVARVTEAGVRSDSDETVALDDTFFVTHAASQPWLSASGLDLDQNGFIKVRETLQTTGFADVFAVGDIATSVDHPRPKAGVFAVRQGKPLYGNLRRVLLGRAARAFRPQRHFLSLISTGGQSAVASKWGRAASGGWVWRWKDWIDRRFMDRFNELPDMKREKYTGLLAEFDDQMQCGGCGSKGAADLLSEVLARLGVEGDLDDAAAFEVPDGRSCSIPSTTSGPSSMIPGSSPKSRSIMHSATFMPWVARR